MSRNRRSGMNRRQFLGAVGAGAAGLAGAAMMGSGIASAASPPQPPPDIHTTYEFGGMSTLSVWVDGGYGPYEVMKYAVSKQNEKYRYDGIEFEMDFKDGGCGDACAGIKIATQSIQYFKEYETEIDGVLTPTPRDVIVAPTCSGSAKAMLDHKAGDWENLKQYKEYWFDTCLLDAGANSSDIEMWSKANRDLVDQNGPLRFRTVNFSTAVPNILLGQVACEKSNGGLVYIVSEDDPFVLGMAKGIMEGLEASGCTNYTNVNVPPTQADMEAEISNANSLGASVLIMNCFPDNREEMSKALESTKYTVPNGELMGTYGFNHADNAEKYATALEGMTVVVEKGLPEILNNTAWRAYKHEMEQTYCPWLLDKFVAEWVDETWLVIHTDAVNIATDLMVKHGGDPHAMNNELENEVLKGYFLGDLYWGGNAFPKRVLSYDAQGNPAELGELVGAATYEIAGGSIVEV